MSQEFLHYLVARERHDEMLRQAEHRRLVNRVRANRPRQMSRIYQAIANLLIAAGTRLKQRNQTDMPAARPQSFPG